MLQILSRRGVTFEDLMHIAEKARTYEKATHESIAQIRTKDLISPFSIGLLSVESPPNLKAIKTLLKTQDLTGPKLPEKLKILDRSFP